MLVTLAAGRRESSDSEKDFHGWGYRYASRVKKYAIADAMVAGRAAKTEKIIAPTVATVRNSDRVKMPCVVTTRLPAVWS